VRSRPGEFDDLTAGKELWAIGAVSCRLLSHETSPRFEVRLLTADALIARELFDNEVAAAVYASEQMRIFGAT
jgi:hypothetical protein